MAQASQNQGYSGTRGMGSSARSSTSEAVSDLREMAHGTVDTAERMAQSVTKQAEAVTENVQQVADNLGTAIQKSIRDQPMTTLAMAALMGVVLGALWKS